MESNILKSIIRDHVLAIGPVTAKEIHRYLHSNCDIKCDMYEVAEQVTALIQEGVVSLGDEGDTFEAASDLAKVLPKRLTAAEEALQLVMNDEELADNMPAGIQYSIDGWYALFLDSNKR
jgi:exonuclease VII small subunit